MKPITPEEANQLGSDELMEIEKILEKCIEALKKKNESIKYDGILNHKRERNKKKYLWAKALFKRPEFISFKDAESELRDMAKYGTFGPRRFALSILYPDYGSLYFEEAKKVYGIIKYSSPDQVNINLEVYYGILDWSKSG